MLIGEFIHQGTGLGVIGREDFWEDIIEKI
jgi:hypothetical protein